MVKRLADRSDRRQPRLANPPRRSREMSRQWLLAVALVAMPLFAYWPAYEAGYIWDDDDHVTQTSIQRTATALKWVWTKPGATPQYYPLTHTTFWLEYYLWGTNPAGYHADNVILHALNALLLWRVLRRLEIAGAWLAAAIFALHPVHVESVAWITERKNALSAFFIFWRCWRLFAPGGFRVPPPRPGTILPGGGIPSSARK